MTEYFSKLSKAQARVAALKNNLLSRINIEKEIEAKIYELQYAYQKKYEENLRFVKEIVEGRAVTSGDCERVLSMCSSCDHASALIGEPPEEAEGHAGIKNYWLTVMKNFSHVGDMISEADEKVLAHLTDIRAVQLPPTGVLPEYPKYEGRGLVIEFHFSENEYFTNKVLHKYYKLDFMEIPEEPFRFEGLIPVKMDSSEINWKPNKNLTEKVVKKTQMNKKTKNTRVVTKTEKLESFFNIFKPLEQLEIPKVESEEERKVVLESLMLSDYDLACEIQSELIPKSVLYFMDEELDDDDEYGSGLSDETDEDFSESENEEVDKKINQMKRLAIEDKGCCKNEYHKKNNHA